MRTDAARFARAEPRSVRARAIAEIGVVIVVLAGVVAYLTPTLGEPLLERHGFRQTQTAWTARVFDEGGIDLLHPRMPVLGEPFEVPFEFPLYQALATLPMKLGAAEDTSLRLTSLLCFLFTALLLYGLVRHVAGPVSGVVAVIAFALTPLALLWSRTSMIEYLATAGAVGLAWGIVLWRDRRQLVFLVLAVTAGLVGMLVKPTTAVFWILPALLYKPRAGGRGRRRSLPDRWTVAAVSVPVLAAALWTRHADAIKAASPATEWLTGWNLRRWNYGWTRQRIDPDAWWLILDQGVSNMLGFLGLLLVPAAVATWRSPQRPFWLGIGGALFLPVLVFMNLYLHHDYYLIAVSPAAAALVGLGSGWLWSVVRPRWLTAPLAALAVLLIVGTLGFRHEYWQPIHGEIEDPRVVQFAGEIARHTERDDLVGVVGLDWSPAFLYYAQRRGHMVPEAIEDTALDRIRDGRYRYLFVADPAHDDLGLLSRWRSVGSLGPHLYELGTSAREARSASVVSTEPDAALAATLAAARPVAGAPPTIPCGSPQLIPAGRRGTWIRLVDPSPDARVFVAGLAPAPVRGALFVSTMHAVDGRVALTCAGAMSLVVDAVVDAPAP